MADARPEIKMSDVMAAVGFALGVPSDELKGFVVVGVKHDDSYEMSANLPNTLHTLVLLSEVVTRELEAIASSALPILLA